MSRKKSIAGAFASISVCAIFGIIIFLEFLRRGYSTEIVFAVCSISNGFCGIIYGFQAGRCWSITEVTRIVTYKCGHKIEVIWPYKVGKAKLERDAKQAGEKLCPRCQEAKDHCSSWKSFRHECTDTDRIAEAIKKFTEVRKHAEE